MVRSCSGSTGVMVVAAFEVVGAEGSVSGKSRMLAASDACLDNTADGAGAFADEHCGIETRIT